jgi:hypothetical protein
VTDLQAALARAREGSVPASWKVFTKRRGAVVGFVTRTASDPVPMLVLTPEGVIEYLSERVPPRQLPFDELAEISLQVRGRASGAASLSARPVERALAPVRADVWIDLHFRDGEKSRWRTVSFGSNLEIIQAFIEAFGAHKALRADG